MIIGYFYRSYHRVSQLFQPISIIPKNATLKKNEFGSKSQKLMLDCGIIRLASPGCYHYLPLAVRSLEKLIKVIDDEMRSIGGQKMILPTLTNLKLWKRSGRLDEVSSELFRVKDRHEQEYVLSPTYEEAISDLIATISPISYKSLPIRLYQITSKYRDEMKPRFGLMRSKQFFMKDMYSFDVDINSAKQTYDEVMKSYDRIFSKIGIEFVKVLGNTGHIGGTLSHEYHYISDIGEDRILTCPNCKYSANVEISGEEKCPQCNHKKVEINAGIEVGHTFLLEDKYSKPLSAHYLTKNGKTETLQMGCYGLGVSRILAAAIEVLSKEHEIRWPDLICPYNVMIIPPKEGSKEENQLENPKLLEDVVNNLESLNNLKNNIIIDDRINFTIGKRVMEAKRNGYPFIIVLGNKIIETPPLFEVIDLKNEKQHFLNETELYNYIKDNILL